MSYEQEIKARNARLNASYRGEGWGLVTDQSLSIEPVDVESQARMVARWAYERIKFLDLLVADLVQHEGAEGFSAHTHKALEAWEPLP